jgi:hypothetical protein
MLAVTVGACEKVAVTSDTKHNTLAVTHLSLLVLMLPFEAHCDSDINYGGVASVHG